MFNAHKCQLVILLATSLRVMANDPLILTIQQGGTTVQSGFSSIDNLISTAKNTASIQSAYPNLNFNPANPATVGLNYLGNNLTLATTAFTNNSQQLTLTLDQINHTVTGSGASATAARQDAFNQMQSYLKTNGGNLWTLLQKQVVASTPFSIIAGNPASLQSIQASNDFQNAYIIPTIQVNGASPDHIPNLFGLGFTHGQFSQNGIDVSFNTLPLSYTWRSNSDAGKQLILSMPISEGSVGGARVYSAQPALGARFPINEHWSLSPFLGVGFSGSSDLGQATVESSTSLTSDYNIPLADNRYAAIGNMIGYYKTLRFTAGGYTVDPDIHNTIFVMG